MAEPSPAQSLSTVRRAGGAFGRRPTRWLEAGSTLWTAAEAMYLVALLVVAYRDGGVQAVALVTLLQSLPSVVIAPLVMAAADRIPRTSLLRAVLVVRVASLASATALLASDAPMAALYLLAAIDGVASTLLRPIRGALVPMTARTPAELVSANVAITTGASAANLVGPAIAAAVLALTGAAPVFGVATAAFGLALVVATRIRAGEVRRPVGRSTTRPATPAGVGSARPVLAAIVGQRYVRGMLSVLVTATAIELLGAGDETVGVLNAAIGLGGLVGSLLSVALVGRRRLAGPFLGAIGVWGIALAAPAVLPLVVPAIAFFVISGAGKSVLEIAGTSLLQRTVPSASRGRVLGILESMITAALAAGAVSASLLVEWLGAGGALLAAGGLTVLVAAAAWPRVRAADVASVVPEAELRVLRTVPFFQPLQLDVIERLAGALGRRHASAGDTIVRQGEPGDRFYIVESGRLETLVDGRATRGLGPGDSFGEIALLRDVPRTATVRALEPASLAMLAREDFLAAVTAHDESTELAEGVVRSRLGT